MNFLELCKSVRSLAGITGEGPTSTLEQSGEMLRVVNWVAQSWIDIQNLHDDWNFLIKDFSFTVTQGKAAYTPAQMGAPDLRRLDVESLRCNRTSLGYQDMQHLLATNWQGFRNMYLFSTRQTGRSTRFSVDPKDKSLNLALIPDTADYTISGRYFCKPVRLVAEEDTPAMPENHHMLIVYWALSKYAGYEAAGEVKQEALENRLRMMSALEADQLPEMLLEGWL